jgi:hypothetical protein
VLDAQYNIKQTEVPLRSATYVQQPTTFEPNVNVLGLYDSLTVRLDHNEKYTDKRIFKYQEIVDNYKEQIKELKDQVDALETEL